LILLALGRSAEVQVAGAVASILLIVNSGLAVAMAFHVRVRQHLEAFALLVGEALETAIVLMLVVHGAPLVQLVAAPVVGGVVALSVALLLARHRFGVRLSFDRTRLRHLAIEAAPVALAGIVGIAIVRLDSVMLAALRPSSDLGIYGAAYQ